MKTRGGRFLMVLGVALAIMAFVVVYVVMQKGLVNGAGAGQAQAVPTVPPSVSIAIVARDVPAYTILDASSVTTIDVDASTVPSGTTSTPTDVFGKMTLVPLTKGQPVSISQLTSAGFSDILTTGERAFSLAVPARDTFGDAVTENDHVDLLWSAAISYKAQSVDATGKPSFVDTTYTTTKTLLQNVHVLRVIQLAQPVPAGQATQGSPASTNSNNNNSTQEASATVAAALPSASMYSIPGALYQDAPFESVVILGVTDQQAEVLTFARDNGQIDLTLRSSAVQKDDKGAAKKDATGNTLRGDAQVEKTTGITLDTLIQQYGLPAPKAYTPQQ
jgi:Flp pilus assembly protein CpaB